MLDASSTDDGTSLLF